MKDNSKQAMPFDLMHVMSYTIANQTLMGDVYGRIETVTGVITQTCQTCLTRHGGTDLLNRTDRAHDSR